MKMVTMPEILFESDHLRLQVEENGDLKMVLTKEADGIYDGELRDDLTVAEQEGGLDGALCELLEEVIANSSLEWIRPEEVGALTSAPILGYDVPRNDNGDITSGDFRHWAFMDCQILDPVKMLLTNSFCVWQKGTVETK
jgi:hypothetical protein